MIKINLVPVKEKKKRKEFLIGFFIVLGFAVISLGMAWIYVQRVRVENGLENEIHQIDEESKGYQEKINEVKDLQSKEVSLEAFKKTIKGISEIQRKVIVGVDQLALNLPEGVWLSGLKQGSGSDSNKFIAQGYAFARESLKDYLSSLQKTGGLLKDSALDLKNISMSVGNNKQIYQFEISSKVLDLGS